MHNETETIEKKWTPACKLEKKVKFYLDDDHVICYEENIHNILPAAHKTMTYGKNQTKLKEKMCQTNGVFLNLN